MQLQEAQAQNRVVEQRQDRGDHHEAAVLKAGEDLTQDNVTVASTKKTRSSAAGIPSSGNNQNLEKGGI